MPKSIPPGITREHVLKALAELDAGVGHPFGEPTAYQLVYEGKSYPPKAVVGLAARHLLGRVLRRDEFSSGVAAGSSSILTSAVSSVEFKSPMKMIGSAGACREIHSRVIRADCRRASSPLLSQCVLITVSIRGSPAPSPIFSESRAQVITRG